jgi:hypothetical protein
VQSKRIPQTTLEGVWNTLPLTFIPNVGQVDPEVSFVVQGLNGTLFFTSKGMILAQTKLGRGAGVRNPEQLTSVLRFQFEGTNSKSQIKGDRELPGVVNYFIGNDPAKWRTNVTTYRKLNYTDLYPGIDLSYEGYEGNLKSTYTVAPGADPSQIGWRYQGADDVQLEKETGDLLVSVPISRSNHHHLLREQAPIAWQIINNTQVPVEAAYAIVGDGKVGFALGNYDPEYPLVIDPAILIYSTYLGGSSFDLGFAIAVDDSSNVYLTGTTSSDDFPTRNAYDTTLAVCGTDAFIAKIDTTQYGKNSLIYSTYLGGSGNCANDGGLDIAIDSAGHAYVTGFVQANDFPTVNAYDTSKGNGPSGDDTSNDAFVVKLDPTGSSLLYSTYLGGSADADDIGHGIAVDNESTVYVGGFSCSDDFPTKNAFQNSKNGDCDSFATRLDTTKSGDASLVYSTYLGGDGIDEATGIAIDNTGSAFLSGHTNSSDFPTKNAFQDSYGGDSGDISGWGGDYFVTELDTTRSGSASLLYSTYLGGSGNEGGSADSFVGGVAIDGLGYVYVTGETKSGDFPVKNAYQVDYGGGGFDAFIAKLNPTQTGDISLIYSTYLGGVGDDIGYNIAVNGSGNAYVAGHTSSTNFPLKYAYQTDFGGGALDAFVTGVAVTGNSLLVSTYLGGTAIDGANDIAVDNVDNVYVTGQTTSDNFPIQNPYDNELSDVDGFVTKLAVMSSQIYLPVITKSN